MKTKNIKNANYIGWIVIILTFLFIYFSYFFIFIPRKEAQVQQKAFRILKEYGSNMIDKNKYYESHFKNYGLFYSIRSLKKAKLILETSSSLCNEDSLIFTDIKNVIHELFPYVVSDTLKIDSSFFFSEKENKLYLNYPIKNTELKSINLIKKYYKPTDEKNLDILLKTTFSNRVPIEKFMESLKFDELFEKITFFDKSMAYYNSKFENLFDITNPGALNDTTRKTQGGTHKTINIRGENKHVMILPLNFKGKEYFIAGFISDTAYRHKTRNINTQLVIYIAGILLLVFIGMPILKIIFIDPRERLKAIDAVGSGISFMFGIGLLIIIIISVLKNQVADRVLNYNRINQISNVLRSNIQADIDSIKCLGSIITQDGKTCSANLAQPVIEHFKSSNRFKKVKTLNSPYKLNEIILIDSTGIVQKAYSRTAFSEVVKFDLNERQYFKNAFDLKNSWPAENGLNYYIESIKSYNTGDVETAVSFHTNRFDSLPVMAITSKIPSLYSQVLPDDIKFVIIDKKGKVLYHSKKDKNLHENFIMESDSDQGLIKAIDLSIKQNITLNYDEKNWLACVVPLKNTPLYHITLLDLNYGGNINARIFLFTFYFFLISFIFLSAILLSLSLISRSGNKKQKHFWILHWIILQPTKYNIYKASIPILAIIIIFQIIGIFISLNPVYNLIYQLIFIFYILSVSIYLFSDNESKLREFLQLKFLPVLILLIISVLLVFSFLKEFNLISALKIPLLFVLLSAPLIPFILKYFNKAGPAPDMLKHLPGIKIRNAYLTFLFLWLSGLSAVPVVQYYFSFKKQENLRWIQQQQMHIARKNIDLFNEYENRDALWFNRIQGNNIDSVKILYEPITHERFDLLKNTKFKYANLDSLYALLPDPINIFIKSGESINSKNHISEWFVDNKLYFEQGDTKGAFSVNYPKIKISPNPKWYILTIVFVFTMTITLLILLLKYLSDVILNLKQEEPFVSKLSWFEIFEDTNVNRIVLNSFDGYCFLEESRKHKRGDKICEIKNNQAINLVSSDFELDTFLNNSDDIIWISGFNSIIFELDSHEKFISNLTKLNQKAEKLIILDIPFDTDLINEFYDDYVEAGELNPDELNKIYLLRKKWSGLFYGYSKFNGYLHQNSYENSSIYRIEDRFRNCKKHKYNLQFSEIWRHLTSYERIVLHDLAEDGLINRKNNLMIRKLIDKGLIIPYPYPDLFSDEFREFVMNSMKPDEIKTIEKKLGLKGRWHNVRYLIIMIIVPLTALILISQGLSMEKIFGIFAGGIAAVTGIIRLFDSNIFKQTS